MKFAASCQICVNGAQLMQLVRHDMETSKHTVMRICVEPQSGAITKGDPLAYVDRALPYCSRPWT